MAKRTIENGDPVVLIREDGYARVALVTGVVTAPDRLEPTIDCIIVDEHSVIVPHRGVPHDNDMPVAPLVWRRQADHSTKSELERDSAR